MVFICIRYGFSWTNAAHVGNAGYNLHPRTSRRSNRKNDDGKSLRIVILIFQNTYFECLLSLLLFDLLYLSIIQILMLCLYKANFSGRHQSVLTPDSVHCRILCVDVDNHVAILQL